MSHKVALDKGALDKLGDHLAYYVETASSTSHGKRVDAFKGKKLLEVLKKYKKGKYEDDDTALHVASLLLQQKRYFHRAEKNPDKTESKSRLIFSKKSNAQSTFEPKGRYVMIHEGSKTWRNVYLTCIIVGFFLCCLFPIWPRFVKVGVWYLSVTFLLAMIVLIVFRLTVFGIAWICGYDIWVLPNVFDDDASFFDSFKPLIHKEPSGGQIYGRIGVTIFLVAACYWVYQQPTEFDGYISAQRTFIDDLYSGALLTDMSQHDKDNLDTVIPVEELLRMEQEEAAAAAAELEDADSDTDFMDKFVNEVIDEDEDVNEE